MGAQRVCWQTCLVYLDDVILLFRTVHDHIRHFQDVSLELHKAGVSRQPSKCHLLQETVGFLKHVLRDRQLLVNCKNIKSLAHALSPRDQMMLECFRGTCSMYRRFSKNHAYIAKHPTTLTRKKLLHALPMLDAANLAAFKDLKERQPSTQIMERRRRESFFTMGTDAFA